MDVTPIFKACVMTVRLRNKSLPVPNKNRILQKKEKDEFSKSARDIFYQITCLKKLLLENRAAYMKFAYHLKNSAQMTDDQRDLIDSESEKIVEISTQYINSLRGEYKKKNLKKQLSDHIENVLDMLLNYVKAVQNIHLEQKRYRMQHELETYKLLKLESDKKKVPVRPVGEPKKKTEIGSSVENVDDPETQDNVEDSRIEKKTSPQRVAIDEDIQKTQMSYEENELTSEDIQVFESENIQLYHELQGLSEEVEQIEKNVVDIAKLQDLFTEKVSLQKHDIERIANTVVGATENVKDANEQIKQAIQRNAGLRVWALFFLIVMSFTLLFLDWYND
uniref:Syntaxin-18 n=1 Tax=Tabanus bromius TaxID=304241 RepID=A0A0K8TS75_TABBR